MTEQLQQADRPGDSETADDGDRRSIAPTRRTYLTGLAAIPLVGSAASGKAASSPGSIRDSSSSTTGYGAGGYGMGPYGGSIDLCTYAGDGGTIGTDGLRRAVDNWRSGTIDTELLLDVIGAWQSNEQVSDCSGAS